MRSASIRGAVDKRPGTDEANLIVNELLALEDLEARYTRGVSIRLLETEQGLVKLEQLHEILRGHPGNYPLELTLCLADGSRVPCACADFRVGNTPEMRSRVEELLGPGNLPCKPPAPATADGRGEELAGA